MADHVQRTTAALPAKKAVVVIGAGTKGSGIAEVAACAGHTVYLRDTSEAARARGMAQIRRSLDKRVERGRLEPSRRDAIVARLRPVTAQAQLENAGLVIAVIAVRLGANVALETALALERRLFERRFDKCRPEGRHARLPGEAATALREPLKLSRTGP